VVARHTFRVGLFPWIARISGHGQDLGPRLGPGHVRFWNRANAASTHSACWSAGSTSPSRPGIERGFSVRPCPPRHRGRPNCSGSPWRACDEGAKFARTAAVGTHSVREGSPYRGPSAGFQGRLPNALAVPSERYMRSVRKAA